MNKLWNKIKNNILISSIIFIILFIITYFILKIFNIQYRLWVYYVVLACFIIGLIIGIIQLLRKKNGVVKLIVLIISILSIIFIIGFSKVIILAAVFSYRPEHVVEKDGKRYVAYVHSFLNVDVYYYDYINFFLIGNKARIHEYYGKGGYDPFDEQHTDYEPKQTIYFDESGKRKDNNSEVNSMNNYKNNIVEQPALEIDSETRKTNEVIYEKKVNNNISIRIKHLDYVLAQRSIIGIEKTTDGGENWINQNELQIHKGTKFIFINENIGFINDPGLAGTDGDNRTLLVTIDGGEHFQEAKFNIKNQVYIDGLPYIENDILKVKAHIINNNKTEYIDFYSLNDGRTWEKYKE